jgi:nicotinamidase-related amidase
MKEGFCMFKLDDSLLVVVDCQERMMPAIYDNVQLAKRIEKLVKGCRILEMPILTVQQYTKGLGDTIAILKDALGDFQHIEKISFSCCGEPNFVKKLKETQRKSSIVCGVEAHVCVQQTVLNLLDDGNTVYVIADCIGSRFETDRLYSESRMRQAGAVLTTMESVLFELLGSADHPKRKEISQLVK